MTLNLIGLAAAAATFFGVWFGHVAVRKIEARAAVLWPPMAGAILLGLGLETAALLSQDPRAAAALGILGVTAAWDALEFVRQHRRVRRGHAPANPANPRHARWLAAGQATTVDRLARDPLGRPVSGGDSEIRR